MSADTTSGVQLTSARARVHGDRLADDEAIADELADGLAGVGVGDLVDLVRVKPDLALATADHGGREALLGAKVDPIQKKTAWSALFSSRSVTRSGGASAWDMV